MPSIHVKEPVPEEPVQGPDPAFSPMVMTQPEPVQEPEPAAAAPVAQVTPQPTAQPPVESAPPVLQPEAIAAARESFTRYFTRSSALKVVAAAVVLVPLFMLINDRQSLKKEVNTLKDPGKVQSASDTQEAEQLKEEVGKLYEIPQDETPTVATVVDASKVKNQAFFANSQNGDKVLLFAKAGKAVLYRPSTKKIIEVAPINLGNGQQQSQTPASTPSVTPTNSR